MANRRLRKRERGHKTDHEQIDARTTKYPTLGILCPDAQRRAERPPVVRHNRRPAMIGQGGSLEMRGGEDEVSTHTHKKKKGKGYRARGRPTERSIKENKIKGRRQQYKLTAITHKKLMHFGQRGIATILCCKQSTALLRAGKSVAWLAWRTAYTCILETLSQLDGSVALQNVSTTCTLINRKRQRSRIQRGRTGSSSTAAAAASHLHN